MQIDLTPQAESLVTELARVNGFADPSGYLLDLVARDVADASVPGAEARTIEELDALIDQGIASGSSGIDARESLRRLRDQLRQVGAGESGG